MAARARDGVKLDVEAETFRLFFALGAAHAVAIDPGAMQGARKEQLSKELWELFPFVKALGALGRAHPDELLGLWMKELEAMMPFGLPPVGLPKEEEA